MLEPYILYNYTLLVPQGLVVDRYSHVESRANSRE